MHARLNESLPETTCSSQVTLKIQNERIVQERPITRQCTDFKFYFTLQQQKLHVFFREPKFVIKHQHIQIYIKKCTNTQYNSIEYAGIILLISAKTKSTHSTHCYSLSLSLSHTQLHNFFSAFSQMLIEEQGHHTHTTNLHQIKQSLKVLVLAEPCAEMPFNDLLSLSLSLSLKPWSCLSLEDGKTVPVRICPSKLNIYTFQQRLVDFWNVFRHYTPCFKTSISVHTCTLKVRTKAIIHVFKMSYKFLSPTGIIPVQFF